MAITRAEVEHVANLARLALSEEELAMFEEQLSRILDHAARVTALDTEGIEPTAHAIPLVNVFRPDEIVPPLPRTEALRNAPDVEDGYFRIPKILEEGG
ncbi:MAG: Asp-tRNA(Asn)/Glu-tRNA(Gln) amidotransferase subunit GatC [Actinomycetota bacterium]|nr:Asp-tRNA(Asn)/Glu-tRNA(Gln) amidotransferase subunit GatC [Actinomycetota bacterium]